MFVTLVLIQCTASIAMPTCNATIDSHDPVHGKVRAGNDFKCVDKVATLDACVDLCCKTESCVSFSYNAPWTMDADYMGCKKPSVGGKATPCCCLKDKVTPPEDNHFHMNITTGVVPPKPPKPPASCQTSLDCNLNGVLLASSHSSCPLF
jgi:hypothetical protein